MQLERPELRILAGAASRPSLHLTLSTFISFPIMDNQQNQAGSSMPGTEPRTPNANSGAGALADNTSASARKTTSPSSESASGASARSSAQGTAGRQEGEQPEAGFLNTALESGKKWIEDSHVLDSVNQLPQNVKDWGSRAAARVGGLSTTQKVVGGALLAAGLGWLATRRSKPGSSPSVYGREGSQSSGGYTRKSGYGYQAPDASNRRPVATSRTSTNPSFGGSGSSYGGASSSDYGSQTSESGRASESSFRAKNDDYRSIE
jgi:hypothetical protein